MPIIIFQTNLNHPFLCYSQYGVIAPHQAPDISLHVFLFTNINENFKRKNNIVPDCISDQYVECGVSTGTTHREMISTIKY